MNEENLTRTQKKVTEIEIKRTETEIDKIELFKHLIIEHVKNNKLNELRKILIKLKGLLPNFDVNNIRNNDETLLHLAVRTLYDYTDDHGFAGYNKGHSYHIENYTRSMYNIIEMLIDADFNITDLSYDRLTPIEYAKKVYREEIAEYIEKCIVSSIKK